MQVILCGIYLIFSILGLTFMKLGSITTNKAFIQILSLKFTLQSIIGYACYAISFLIYTVVITKFDLSYIIPVLGGIVNILVLIIGILLFHEKVTMLSIIGSIFVILGVLLMNWKL